MLKIRENIHFFAGAKTWQQLKAYNDMLIGKDGNVISKEEFKQNINAYQKEALGIDELYNQTWLGTEWDTAVHDSEMGRMWDEFQNNKDLFPNLTYITTDGDNVCDICEPLDGITLPMDDPFWDSYMPQNHWGCVCRVEQNDNPVTEGETPQPEISEMFDNNVGKTGSIFEKHPFFERNGIDMATVKKQVDKFLNNESK